MDIFPYNLIQRILLEVLRSDDNNYKEISEKSEKHVWKDKKSV